MGVIPENTQAAFNYGLDKVRFLAPVRVGSRVRLHATLLSMEDKGPGQYLMKVANTIEIEGEEKPALTAETLAMFYERRRKQVATG
jgi:acyl dehydratase